MASVRNILFIMCDQLRADYLGCAGHPTIRTPNLDALAAKGVMFDRSYCQSPVCGASRMCFYTGRYAFTNGATWNSVPLSIGQPTLGDHLRRLGVRTAIVGKTHMTPDRENMKRLGMSPEAVETLLASEGGFEPFERDDGIWGGSGTGPENLAYNRYLRELGYDSPNPWHDFANSAEGPDGEILSGWQMRNCHLPARVREEHSETPYMTDRAMRFIMEAGSTPWCLHLSYIKPHWPYMAPAPYHNMYARESVIPVNRDAAELRTMHPVLVQYTSRPESEVFAQQGVRENVIPAYMGLTSQIDTHVGRLLAFLEQSGIADQTMVVFTSDHGDFLGDHWLAEKMAYYEESIRLPMIVYDPRPEADATRGTVDSRLVESIDLVPTFIEAAGGEPPSHILEGRSLLPLLRGEADVEWRDFTICESENSFFLPFWDLDLTASEARSIMLRTDRWKYVHHLGLRPELFDMKSDPRERTDLGESAEHEAIRTGMRDMLFEFLARRKTRITMSDGEIEARTRRVLDSPRPNRYGQW